MSRPGSTKEMAVVWHGGDGQTRHRRAGYRKAPPADVLGPASSGFTWIRMHGRGHVHQLTCMLRPLVPSGGMQARRLCQAGQAMWVGL